VVLKFIDSPSPRTSGRALAFEDVEGFIIRNVSRNVWIWNVPGVSAVGIERNDSRGDTASVLADKSPYLSQPRYLHTVSYLYKYIAKWPTYFP
jgi:hypothetical protein